MWKKTQNAEKYNYYSKQNYRTLRKITKTSFDPWIHRKHFLLFIILFSLLWTKIVLMPDKTFFPFIPSNLSLLKLLALCKSKYKKNRFDDGIAHGFIFDCYILLKIRWQRLKWMLFSAIEWMHFSLQILPYNRRIIYFECFVA